MQLGHRGWRKGAWNASGKPLAGRDVMQGSLKRPHHYKILRGGLTSGWSQYSLQKPDACERKAALHYRCDRRRPRSCFPTRRYILPLRGECQIRSACGSRPGWRKRGPGSDRCAPVEFELPQGFEVLGILRNRRLDKEAGAQALGQTGIDTSQRTMPSGLLHKP
jgi:hypothetical protein